jgi:phosphate-selective porin OprO/OprP
MSLTKRVGFLTGVAALTLSGVCPAATAEVSNNDVNARIAELEAQVAQLKAASGENWLTEQRAKEIRGLVQDVLADADTRTNLLAAGMTGGWDNGFWLGSADGNNKLMVSGQMQIRWAYNHVDSNVDDVDEDRWGFENPRTKLIFHGHVVDPTWHYKVQANFQQMEDDDDTSNNGQLVLEDAFVEKDFENGLMLTFGQFKLPFLREELVDDSRQLAVERSIINRTYTLDRSQGIMATWKLNDNIKLNGAYSDGFDQRNGGSLKYDTEYAFTSRIEWLAAGTWKQFDDFSSWTGEEMGLLIGGATAYQSQEFGDAAHNNELQTFTCTVDASFESGGWGLYGAFIYRDLDDNVSGGVSLQQYGFVIQGSVFFADNWEGFARYEYGDPDAPSGTDGDTLSVITFGVNKYWAKHNLKWQTDIGIGLDSVNEDFWSFSGTDWRHDPTGSDGKLTDTQVVIRTQLQLLW